MSKKSLSIHAASGTDSTQAQEQAVKSFSSSSSNLNNVSKREQSSSLELPSVSIKGVANNGEVEEFDLTHYALKYFNGNPAVYVGTYAKYNFVYGCEKALIGCWLDLTKFADYDEFLAVCRYIHRDGADPEFMAQDVTDFPREFYTEGFLSEREFEVIQEFANLDEDEREAFKVYVAAFGSSREEVSIYDNFREAYCGEWDSEKDFTYNLVDELGYLRGVPDSIASYFDYEAFARDLFIEDYRFDSGFVFRRL